MKKIILFLIGIITFINVNAQDKYTYVEIIEGVMTNLHPTKVYHVCSCILDGTLIYGMEKSSEHSLLKGIEEKQTNAVYVLPEEGNQFQSALSAMNYLGSYGFELVLHRVDANTGYDIYIMKTKNTVTLRTTVDWKNIENTMINQ